MSHPELSIEALPAWAHLNDITFHDVKVAKTEGRGYGLISQKDLSTENGIVDIPTLLTVPHSLVLNDGAVEEYAKEDRSFKELLEAVGHHSTRRDVLLFLLVQAVLASRVSRCPVGVSNPWTEYVKFLPTSLLVPTLWNGDERLLLRGTSLEAAVNAKLSALTTEFDAVRDLSSGIPDWNETLWEGGAVTLRDWILLDALYRSRCLELPISGESMVPCIDMINHSAIPTAFYDQNSDHQVLLLLRPGMTVPKGGEVTISYGDAKSPAEMLFSYGFIDPSSTADSLVLPLEPFPDDPLAKAKLVAFGESPKIHVARDNGCVWKSPFAYLMCVNEEDGLEFRVLQDSEGGRQLRVFWQDEDVTSKTADFESVIQSHPLNALFRLRVTTIVQECLETQLQRAKTYLTPDSLPISGIESVRQECCDASLLLKQREIALLEEAVDALENERSTLLTDENVVAYLGSMEIAQSDLVDAEASNDAEDFS